MKNRLALILIVLLGFFLRVPFWNYPGADESENAYIAQRMAEGEIIYKDVFSHKMPLVPFLYRIAFIIGGESYRSIRIFVSLFSMLGIGGIYILALLLWEDRVKALFCSFIYSLYYTNPSFFADGAMLEVFMLPLILFSPVFALLGEKKNQPAYYFLSGVILGLCFFIKQPGILFIVPLFFIIFRYNKKNGSTLRIRSMTFLFSGFILICLSFLLYFSMNGALYDFYLDIVEGNAWRTFSVSWPLFRSFIVNNYKRNPAVLLLAGFGMGYSGYIIKKRKEVSFSGRFVFILTLTAGLATASGLYFSPHYFIYTIPAFCLIAAVFNFKFVRFGLNTTCSRVTSKLPIIALLFFSPPIWQGKYYYSADNHLHLFRELRNPGYYELPAMYRAMDFIKNNTAESDRILVWNWQTEIYFLSGRKGISKYFLFPPLPDRAVSRRNERYLSDLKKNKPEIIVIWNPLPENAVTLGNMIKSEYSLVQIIKRPKFNPALPDWNIYLFRRIS